MEILSRRVIRFLIITLSLLFSFSLSFCAEAQNSSEIVINEVAWMGTNTSYSDEWIELYNNLSSSVNLEGWKLIAEDGTPEINLEGEIPAKGFFLLERTDDETVPNIKANLIYKGSLNNKGEYLRLIDNQGKTVDKIDCSSGWFAGDNKTKKTMERKNPSLVDSGPENWQTSQYSGGTPKNENSLVDLESSESILPEKRPETEPKLKEKLETVVYSLNIFINEILPSPEDADAENEWVEIFNQNNNEVDLSFWQISDTKGVTTIYTLPEGTIIKPKEFLVLSRPITKITLNNSGDSLRLTQPDGNILDTITYEKAPLGQSYNRTDSGWAWSPTLTPGSTNIIPTPFLTPKEIESSKEEIKGAAFKKEVKENQSKKELAAIGEQIPKTLNSLGVFLIALPLAILSGAIILILKKRLKKIDLEIKLE